MALDPLEHALDPRLPCVVHAGEPPTPSIINPCDTLLYMGALSRWLHERRACVLRSSLAEPSATCTISICQGPAHKCMQRSSAAECECGSTFTLLGILHSQLLAIPRPALAGWWPLPSGCAGGRWHPGSGCTCPACVLVVARVWAAQLAHRRAHAPLHPQQVCCWMLACAVTSGLANNSCSCCGMLYAGLWQTRFFNWRPLRVSAPPPQSPNPPSQLHSRGSCC